MKQVYFLFLSVLFLASCSTGKKVTYDDAMAGAPGWVRKTPNEPQYYHGIGNASKTAKMDFREKAKQNALSDMAGNISVDISSSSVLNQFETDHTFSEYFMDNIKLSTKNYLEGYELVDNWETADRYWIYYRLSKAEYERIKKDRIQAALSKAEGDCREAEKSIHSGNSAEAIYNYIKAIEKVKDFLGEDIRTETEEKGQSYTSRLFADLTATLQNIRIIFPVNSFELKRGQKPGAEDIPASVTNENNVNLTGIPITTGYSWFPGKKDEFVSDASGKIRIKPGTINSSLKTEYISTVVNFDKMVKETTQDPVVQKLLVNIRAMAFILPVNITPSAFFVEVTEKSPDQKITNSGMLQEITARLTNDGFTVASNPAAADFVLSVIVNTTKNPERNGKFSAILIADFGVTNNAGRMIFNLHIPDVTGLGANDADALKDAYTALSSRIRISVFPAFYKVVFSN